MPEDKPRSVFSKILNSMEPPDKNPYYFKWKLTTPNRVIMLVLLPVTVFLSFILPGYPSPLRGFTAINTGLICFAAGFQLKYILLDLRQAKYGRWVYDLLMNEDRSGDDNYSVMVFVFICQFAFLGFSAAGIFLFFWDIMGF